MAQTRGQEPPILELDQITLRTKLALYCRQKNYDGPIVKDLEDKTSGHCQGMSVVTVYALWLQFQPNPKSIPRDDLNWLNGVTRSLASWNGDLTSLTPLQTKEIERYLSLIGYYQDPAQYSANTTQSALESTFSDTHEGRKVSAEYAFSGIFSAEKWKQELLADAHTSSPPHEDKTSLASFIKEDRLVLLGSTDYTKRHDPILKNHATALLKHDDVYYFFDSNNRQGITEFKADAAGEKALIDEIFMRNFKTLSDPSALSLQAYSIDQAHENYPDKTALLSQLTVQSADHQQDLDAIRQAIKAHDLSSVKFYLKNANVNEYLTGSDRLLTQAAIEDATEIIVYLIQQHLANVDLPNKSGKTPLFLASYFGHAKTVQVLLDNGADPNISDGNDASPLQMASQNGHLEIAIMLVAKRAKVTTVCLMSAIAQGHVEVAKFLISKGALLEGGEQDALRVAAEKGSLTLFEHIITPLIAKDPAMIDSLDPSHRKSWLMIAADNGHDEIAKYLLEHKATVTDSASLFQAAMAGSNDHGKVVGVLLEHMPCSLESFKSLINKALRYKPNVMKVLLDYAQQHQITLDLQSLLNQAAELGATEVAALLLNRGADVKQHDSAGKTALHYACSSSTLDTLKLLIDHGANINADPQQNGQTPLFLALSDYHLHAHTFNLLLAHGADHSRKDIQELATTYNPNTGNTINASYQAFVKLSQLSQQIQALPEDKTAIYPNKNNALHAFQKAANSQLAKVKESLVFHEAADFLEKEWLAYANLEKLISHLEKIKQTPGTPNIKDIINAAFLKIVNGKPISTAYAELNTQVSALIQEHQENKGFFAKLNITAKDRFISALALAQKTALATPQPKPLQAPKETLVSTFRK